MIEDITEINRCMIDPYEAVPMFRAKERGLTPAIVFVRGDGWTLAAPKGLERAAYKLWSDEWVGFARWPQSKVYPISYWKGL